MKKKNLKIFYIGNFIYPSGNAAGNRVSGSVDTLRSIGIDVYTIGVSNSKNHINECNNDFFEKPKGINRLFSSVLYFRKFRSFLKEKITGNDEILIINYGTPSTVFFNFIVLLYSKLKGFRNVYDCVDFLTVKTNNKLFDFVKKTDEVLQKKILNKYYDGIICISNYIEKYYAKKGCLTVVFPPVNKKREIINFINHKNALGEPLSFIYAGYPFREDIKENDVGSMKDRVDIVILLFYEILNNYKIMNFKLKLYGFDKEVLFKKFSFLESKVDSLGDKVEIKGNIEASKLVDEVMNSDFSILIRDKKIDSIAGFPSKISESISLGTPVIVSDIGDMNLYIKNGFNGFLIGEDQSQNLKILSEVISLKKSQVLEMSNNCLKFNPFDGVNYYDRISEFLDKVMTK